MGAWSSRKSAGNRLHVSQIGAAIKRAIMLAAAIKRWRFFRPPNGPAPAPARVE